jgi:hypothetical protein
MQNLIKVDCSGFVVKKATYNSPLISAWDDLAALGNLSASQTTSKVGTGGSGSGLTAEFTTNADPIISQITITAIGLNYEPGDVITFSFTAADDIATGSFDVTLTIPADGGEITFNPATDAGSGDIAPADRYIDASVCVGLESTSDFDKDEPWVYIRTNKVQTASSGQATKTISYQLLIAGIDPGLGGGSADIVKAASEISECLKDAWQNPNSQPELNSYLSKGSVANVYLKVV